MYYMIGATGRAEGSPVKQSFIRRQWQANGFARCHLFEGFFDGIK